MTRIDFGNTRATQVNQAIALLVDPDGEPEVWLRRAGTGGDEGGILVSIGNDPGYAEEVYNELVRILAAASGESVDDLYRDLGGEG